MNDGQSYLTSGQVAKMLNITRQAVDLACVRKRLIFTTTGVSNIRLFTIDTVEDYRRDFARKADKETKQD